MPETVGSISNLQLKLGLWYARNKILFRKALILFLILLNAFFFGYSVFATTQLFAVHPNEYENVMKSLVVNGFYPEAWNAKYPLSDLQVTRLDVVPSGPETSNISAVISNPNTVYVAKKVKYDIYVSSEIVASGETYVWPESTKYVVAYGIKGTPSPADANVSIYNVEWLTMAQHESFVDERMNFEIRGIQATPERAAIEGKRSLGTIGFYVRNQTVFNYYDVGFTIAVLSGNNLAGIYYARIDTLKSLEEKYVEVNTLIPFPGVPQIQIEPDINVLNPNVYFTDDTITGDLK